MDQTALSTPVCFHLLRATTWVETLAFIWSISQKFTWGGNQLYTTPYIDGGFTKLLSNDLQLDVYAGVDLSTEFGSRLPTNGFFFGTGVSYRFPLAAYFEVALIYSILP